MLADELLVKIFEFFGDALMPVSLAKLSMTCKQLYATISKFSLRLIRRYSTSLIKISQALLESV